VPMPRRTQVTHWTPTNAACAACWPEPHE
jgi:hypothetical protein